MRRLAKDGLIFFGAIGVGLVAALTFGQETKTISNEDLIKMVRALQDSRDQLEIRLYSVSLELERCKTPVKVPEKK